MVKIFKQVLPCHGQKHDLLHLEPLPVPGCEFFTLDVTPMPELRLIGGITALSLTGKEEGESYRLTEASWSFRQSTMVPLWRCTALWSVPTIF